MSNEAINAGRLMEMSRAYWESCALHAAVRLDIFTLIGDRPCSGEELAQRLNADRRSLVTLLNALTALGLLTRSGETFANTEVSAAHLSKDSPRYMGYIIQHHYHLMDSWHQLDRVVLTGEPARARSTDRGDEERESFCMGMFNVALPLAARGAKEIDLSSRKQLLDLGGGPGTWAIHFCLANSTLKATVFDLPATRPFAETTIARYPVADRVAFREGNFLEDEIGDGYDVAWLSHILHGEAPETCQLILDRAVAALEPGGLILVHDFILNDDLVSPRYPALFSLNMLTGTAGGRSYSEGQIRQLLARAGVGNIQRLSFRGPGDSGVLAGTV